MSAHRPSALTRRFAGVLIAFCVGTLACNAVPARPTPEPELRVVAPLDEHAIQRLRVGDSQRKVRVELGEPHQVSLGNGGGQTWRYWVIRPAFQVAAEPPRPVGFWSGLWAWMEGFLFVPSSQPPPRARVVVPAQSHELVIVFGPEGDLLVSRYESLKR